MDIVTFDHLAAMHRKDLESSNKVAKNARNNLVRMVEEQIALIDSRAEQDKENISIMFTKLITDQEIIITRTAEALGGYISKTTDPDEYDGLGRYNDGGPVDQLVENPVTPEPTPVDPASVKKERKK